MKTCLLLILAQFVIATQLRSQTTAPGQLPDKIVAVGSFLHRGELPFTPGMTLMSGLEAAGLVEFANVNTIYVIRCGKPDKVKLAHGRTRPEDDLKLQPWDILYLPESVF